MVDAIMHFFSFNTYDLKLKYISNVITYGISNVLAMLWHDVFPYGIMAGHFEAPEM